MAERVADGISCGGARDSSDRVAVDADDSAFRVTREEVRRRCRLDCSEARSSKCGRDIGGLEDWRCDEDDGRVLESGSVEWEADGRGGVDDESVEGLEEGLDVRRWLE